MTQIHRSAEWAALTRRLRPIYQQQVEAGVAVCVDCNKPIYPTQKFAVGHILPASTHPELALMEWNCGPSHHGKNTGQRNCNQIAGGRMGAEKTNAKKARATGKEYPSWY